MSLNSNLLSYFLRNIQLGYDIKSRASYHQIISTISANIAILSFVIIFEIAAHLLLNLPNIHLTLFISPFAILTFTFLRVGKIEAAAAAVLLSMHLANLYLSYFYGLSMLTLYTQTLFPISGFLLTSSLRVRTLNMCASILQCIGHAYRINDKFSSTLTFEQSFEVFGLLASAFMCMIFLCIICFVQKLIEDNLWEAAQADYNRSERLTQEIMQAIQSKDTFVASLSHEIRNPLNSMNGSIDYLVRVVKDPDYIHVLQNAKQSGEVLLSLVNNVLDAAKLKADKMELLCTKTEITQILKKVLTINNQTLNHANLSCHVSIDKELPDKIWIDQSRFLQILMNLMSNSIKFTPKRGEINIDIAWCPEGLSTDELMEPISGTRIKTTTISNNSSIERLTLEADHNLEELSGIHFDDIADIPEEFENMEAEAHIRKMGLINSFKRRQSDNLDGQPWTIRRTRINSELMKLIGDLEDQAKVNEETTTGSSAKGFLKVQITDTGCGISQTNISKLFEMFTQAHKGVASTYGGTGLGLWICKQLCQKMGGDIKVYSELKKGTTFLFYIPVLNGQIAQDCDLLSKTKGPQRKINALVVDDCTFNRNLHKLLLEREGVEVILASDGKEAVEKFQAHEEGHFSFIMMDTKMPEMDGFTATKRIREWEAQKSMKKIEIYFISSGLNDESQIMFQFNNKEEKGETSGVHCLRKPIDVEAISGIVNNYKS